MFKTLLWPWNKVKVMKLQANRNVSLQHDRTLNQPVGITVIITRTFSSSFFQVNEGHTLHYPSVRGGQKQKRVCVLRCLGQLKEGGAVGWGGLYVVVKYVYIVFYCVSLISYLRSIWKGPQTQTGNNNNNKMSQTWIPSGSVETSSTVTHLFLVRNTTNAVTGQPYWKGERRGVGGWGWGVHNYSILMSITRV